MSGIFKLQLVKQAMTDGAMAPEDHNRAVGPVVSQARIDVPFYENMV